MKGPMVKAKRETKKTYSGETVFMFPEKCSLGVVESVLDDALAPVRFSVVDLAVNSLSSKEFDDILKALRLANSVRVTQLPQLEAQSRDKEKNSLIISFHEEKVSGKDWENPLLAAVVAIGQHPEQTELTAFNDHIVQLETMGLSLDIGEAMSVVMLLDLLAVGSSLFYESSAIIGNYFFKPLYIGQFQPTLKNSLEPLIHALSHCRETKPALLDKDAVNMTGLLPDAFA
jgi:hypothetical protein